MIKRKRFTVNSLPFIPDGSQFMLGYTFAKVENDILHLWCNIRKDWENTKKSLEEYNDYFEKEAHDLDTIDEVIEFSIRSNYQWKEKFKKRVMYIFKQYDGHYYIAYNKPVAKGFKGPDKQIKYGAGEVIHISKDISSKLDELMVNDVMELDYRECYSKIIK